jgi:hypothetical protein
MSQLNSLLESANSYKSLQSDAERLATKWSKTGLLEGLEGSDKTNMSMILENQAKQLVQESSLSGGGAAGGGSFTSQTSVNTGEQWAGVALPLVRKVFGQIAAKEFVSVQPMNLPSGLVFYLDYQYGTTKSPFTSGGSMYGDTDGNTPFGNGATGGAYGAGRYSYSTNLTSSKRGATTEGTAAWSDVNYINQASASVAAGDVVTLSVPLSELVNSDEEAIRSFRIFSQSSGNATGVDVTDYPAATKDCRY